MKVELIVVTLALAARAFIEVVAAKDNKYRKQGRDVTAGISLSRPGESEESADNEKASFMVILTLDSTGISTLFCGKVMF
jgi:hypothetical protein